MAVLGQAKSPYNFMLFLYMSKRLLEKSTRVKQVCTDDILTPFQPFSIVTERFLSQKWYLQRGAVSPAQEFVTMLWLRS